MSHTPQPLQQLSSNKHADSNISQALESEGTTADKAQPPTICIISSQNALPSSKIDKDHLRSVEEVILMYPKLKGESKVGALACKTAKEAIFGSAVMKQSTPFGNRDLPASIEKGYAHTVPQILEKFSKVRAHLEEMH